MVQWLGYAISTTTGDSGTSESVFLCEVMKMLAIHSCLTCRSTDIAMVARQKPRHVAGLKLRFECPSSLTVAERGIEMYGNWAQRRSYFRSAKSRNYLEDIRAPPGSLDIRNGLWYFSVSVSHFYSPGEAMNESSSLGFTLVQPPQWRPVPPSRNAVR